MLVRALVITTMTSVLYLTIKTISYLGSPTEKLACKNERNFNSYHVWGPVTWAANYDHTDISSIFLDNFIGTFNKMNKTYVIWLPF